MQRIPSRFESSLSRQEETPRATAWFTTVSRRHPQSVARSLCAAPAGVASHASQADRPHSPRQCQNNAPSSPRTGTHPCSPRAWLATATAYRAWRA